MIFTWKGSEILIENKEQGGPQVESKDASLPIPQDDSLLVNGNPLNNSSDGDVILDKSNSSELNQGFFAFFFFVAC